jgi:hypothetical protein
VVLEDGEPSQALHLADDLVHPMVGGGHPLLLVLDAGGPQLVVDGVEGQAEAVVDGGAP